MKRHKSTDSPTERKRSLTTHELWSNMRASEIPFALLDPINHVILEANEEYASLHGPDDRRGERSRPGFSLRA